MLSVKGALHVWKRMGAHRKHNKPSNQPAYLQFWPRYTGTQRVCEVSSTTTPAKPTSCFSASLKPTINSEGEGHFRTRLLHPMLEQTVFGRFCHVTKATKPSSSSSAWCSREDGILPSYLTVLTTTTTSVSQKRAAAALNQPNLVRKNTLKITT